MVFLCRSYIVIFPGMRAALSAVMDGMGSGVFGIIYYLLQHRLSGCSLFPK